MPPRQPRRQRRGPGGTGAGWRRTSRRRTWLMRSKTGLARCCWRRGCSLAPSHGSRSERPQGGRSARRPDDPDPARTIRGRTSSAAFTPRSNSSCTAKRIRSSHKTIAVRGLVDVDGSITGDLNGTVVNTDTDCRSSSAARSCPGTSSAPASRALYTNDLRGRSRSSRATSSLSATGSTAARRSKSIGCTWCRRSTPPTPR